jgi:hypothetical protein
LKQRCGEQKAIDMRNRKLVFRALSIGCAVLVASPSWAATIEPGSGELTINQGQGFKPVTSHSNANVGDSVMVGPGGSATVVYDDGCRATVKPGAVVTITPLSPCASGSNAADMGVPPPVVPAQPYVEDSGWAGVAVGVLAAGALGVGIWRASEGNGTTSTPVFSPASP